MWACRLLPQCGTTASPGGGPKTRYAARRALLANLTHTLGADAVFAAIARAARTQREGPSWAPWGVNLDERGVGFKKRCFIRGAVKRRAGRRPWRDSKGSSPFRAAATAIDARLVEFSSVGLQTTTSLRALVM
jgi:hypothetical protein